MRKKSASKAPKVSGRIRTALLAVSLAAAFLFLSLPASSQKDGLPVKEYGGQVGCDRTHEEQAAMETVASFVSGFDGNNLRVEPKLILMARELATAIQKRPSLQSQILSSKQTEDLKLKYGVYETGMHAFSTMFDDVKLMKEQIANEFAKDVDKRYSHMGAGVTAPRGGGVPGVVVILLFEKRVMLAPFPMKVGHPSSYSLKGRLMNSSQGQKPSIFLTSPDGLVNRLISTFNGPNFSASVAFNKGKGVYRLEVVSTGPGSSQLAALLTVEAGDEPAERPGAFEITGSYPYPGDEEEAEKIVLDMINEIRAREGLEKVVHEPRLARMAKEHSEDMRDNNYVGHLSPNYGTIKDRSKLSGLGSYTVKENVALNASLPEAMNNLLRSPAHRVPIIDPENTRVGVGVAFDQRNGNMHFYLTQEFAKM